MTHEKKAEYNSAYRYRNEAHIKQIKRDWYLSTRPAKTERIEVKRKTESEKLRFLEGELAAVEQRIAALSFAEKTECLVSQRNAILLKIETLRSPYNMEGYHPAIAIMR